MNRDMSASGLGLARMMFAVVLGLCTVLSAARAQTPGGTVVRGVVTLAVNGKPLPNARVQVEGTIGLTVTDRNGTYRLLGVPTGAQTIVVTAIGSKPLRITINVVDGQTMVRDLQLDPAPVSLGEVKVIGVSRGYEAIAGAPAAVSVLSAAEARDYASTSQLPLALKTLPGVDAPQNDVNDFNFNTRGFNTTFNRRVLVLQDGRELGMPSVGAQDWNALPFALDNLKGIELVRGPGSALYGANAFGGVLNLYTPEVREVVGTKIALSGGTLRTARLDVRRASLNDAGTLGFQVNVGYSTSDTWSRSRTGIGDLEREYAGIADTVNTPAPGFEVTPLKGQRVDGPFGTAATGRPDPLVEYYGSARVDYYARSGTVYTAEAGASRAQNQVNTSAVGRVQFSDLVRPWARFAATSDNLTVTAWWSGRKLLEPQIALAAGVGFEDISNILHTEARYQFRTLANRLRLVAGASARTVLVNSNHTNIAPAEDDRADQYIGAYGLAEYNLTPKLRVVLAGRYDNGNLLKAQYSGKGALVYEPISGHAVRATVNRAYQTPNILERFVQFPAGLPVDLTQVEASLRASTLGSALASTPSGALFSPSSSGIPLWVLGNKNLDVEKITSYELGYKGQFKRVFVDFALYHSLLKDFVSSVLPGVNPTYAPWVAPTTVAAGDRDAVQQAAIQAMFAAGLYGEGAGLTNLPDGTTAVVYSMGNVGRVTERGVEVSSRVQITPAWSVGASFTNFTFDVKSASVPGNPLVPNTPKNKGNASVAYVGANGFDARFTGQFVDSFEWISGSFAGTVPSSQTADAALGYALNASVRLSAVATNLFDQRRFQVYGGAVIGRRILGGVTVLF